ncbi:MAG: hypothetical protein CL823_02280 [Crocinitomicaceae bacterium]|nr:hypothetical protein [Crocinitomicaceae bacterium]
MKNTLLLAFGLFLTIISTSAQSQTYEQIGSYTQADITSMAASFGIPSNLYTAEYGVDAYKVLYTMPYMDEDIEVSGAMFIPTGVDSNCDLPIHTYMHGTIFERNQAPSFMSIEGILGYLMSSPGYIVLMPDYVGLGESQLMHPYVHAQSEADAGIYMIEAISTFTDDLSFTLNEEIFISGYSQGGHAAMAMNKEIQENWSDSYEVTASAPMAGPYDMSGVQAILSVDVEAYPSPAYFVYNVIGWNSFYGNIYEDLSEIFQEPYASLMPDLFDGETGPAEINAALPTLTSELLQPGIVDEILSDTNHPYMLAAIDNDVHDWTPENFMQIYYCSGDNTVYPENSISAYDHMIENGAENVSLFDGGKLNHGECAGPSIFGGLLWLQQYYEECEPESVTNLNDMDWTIAPNPAPQGTITLIGVPSQTRWNVRDLTGRVVNSGVGSEVSLGHTTSIYFVEVEGRGIVKVLAN